MGGATKVGRRAPRGRSRGRMLWASAELRGTRFGASRRAAPVNAGVRAGPRHPKHGAPGRVARGRGYGGAAYLPCIILPLFGFSGSGGRLAGTLCRMCGWKIAKSNFGLVVGVWHCLHVASVIRRDCAG